MANFFRDYWALMGESWGFMKVHWLGIVILSIICGLVGALVTETIIEPKWPVILWDRVKYVFSRG